MSFFHILGHEGSRIFVFSLAWGSGICTFWDMNGVSVFLWEWRIYDTPGFHARKLACCFVFLLLRFYSGRIFPPFLPSLPSEGLRNGMAWS